MNAARRLWYVAAGERGTSPVVSGLHRALYRLTGGRFLGRMMGCQVVLLTTTGRNTGAARTVPVFGFVEGPATAVVASNAGKPQHPAWYLNLQAIPDAELEIGTARWCVRAREATPEERDRLWPRFARHYRGYEAYRERTARQIPIVILESA